MGRLQTKTASDDFTGLVTGIIATAINSSGGNGGDYTLDVSLESAGTSGVDSAETIFGVASGVEDY